MENKNFNVKAAGILIALILSLAVIGPMLLKEKSNGTKTDYKKTADTQKGINVLVTAKGVVESQDAIQLSSQIKGIIQAVKVHEGDIVKKGQLLVIFDKSKINDQIKLSEAELRQAKSKVKEMETGSRTEDIEMAKDRARQAEAEYQRAKDEYERQSRLYKKDAATLVDLENAEKNAKVALESMNESNTNQQKYIKGNRPEVIEQSRANVEKAGAELNYYKTILKDYEILSPIDGVVAERFMDGGETVDIGTPVLRLVNPARLKIRAELEETDVGKVKEEQSVDVYTDAYKDKKFQGKVYKVFPSVRRKAQKTFDPMASFDVNAQGIFITLDDFTGLKDGMTVTVNFLR